jgi:predicted RNase H-like HicB family nuclease
VDHASWVVTLHSPEEHDFYGKTLEDALARWLV